MPYTGYKPGTNAAGYFSVGTPNSLNQRAYVAAKMTEDGWAYQISVRGGRVDGTTPLVSLAVWSVGAGTAPDVLVARTAAFSTGTAMLDATDGTSYTRDVQTSAMLRNGKRYAPGFVASDAQFGYGVSPSLAS